MALLLVCFAASGCGDGPSDRAVPAPWEPPGEGQELFPVTIVRPPTSGRLRTAVKEPTGGPAAIGCPTCHRAGAVPSVVERRADKSAPYHQHVKVVHADLTCESCHAKDRPDLLHTSGGARFPIAESLRLCSQCHGPIRRAFDHGAHGGMRGYWDLSRGPRTRNHCITCHSPHQPAYPDVQPMPGPKDRFVGEHHPSGSLVEERYSAREAHE